MLDQQQQPPLVASISRRAATPEPDKPLPLTPQLSIQASLSSADAEDEDDVTLLATESLRPCSDPVMTKRQHALSELVDSERAYANDLALIRNVHLPLAQGV